MLIHRVPVRWLTLRGAFGKKSRLAIAGLVYLLPAVSYAVRELPKAFSNLSTKAWALGVFSLVVARVLFQLRCPRLLQQYPHFRAFEEKGGTELHLKGTLETSLCDERLLVGQPLTRWLSDFGAAISAGALLELGEEAHHTEYIRRRLRAVKPGSAVEPAFSHIVDLVDISRPWSRLSVAIFLLLGMGTGLVLTARAVWLLLNATTGS